MVGLYDTCNTGSRTGGFLGGLFLGGDENLK